ncbi:hypothetical protein HY732_03075 [Candidatus Uhrbacteria bacterium]|nr:hypothetical protein [Candidatus Uhrbacteria bacterium]
MRDIFSRSRWPVLRRTYEKISYLICCAYLFLAENAHAAITSDQTGLKKTAEQATLNTAVSVEKYVGGIISAILGIIGVIFLILIVYGGMLWMLAEGDETKIGKARGFIFHSIIGLILVFSAYAITNFVVDILITQAIQ